jgi:hypothetical protein
MSARRYTGLSRSRFCQGLQCPKQLWLRVHEPHAAELAADPALQAIFDRGHRVGEAARERFPGGVLIDGDYWQMKEKVESTRRAIADGVPAIFEAAFQEDGVFVAADVLERRRRGFALAEVKSTLDVKEPHVPDVAIQLHVLRRAGLDVRRAEVMHLNRECRHPDLSNLFVRTDVTRDAEGLLPGIPRRIRSLARMLEGPMPDVEVGPHCTDPYECPFVNRCFPSLPRHHVSTLYRIGARAAALEDEKYRTIRQLPPDIGLSEVAERQVRAVRTGKLVVEPGLGRALGRIQAPIAFLDFETANPAIPAWKGCHPYEHVPVQVSCHVLGARGGVEHHEHLADGPGDPRPAMAAAVVRACAGASTVVAWNAGFERRCLEHLAAAVPPRRAALGEVVRKLVDLLPIVRDHVYHPDFLGSLSQKAVLPALVPGLGYGGLAISEGETASAVLEALLLAESPVPAADRKRLRKDLLRYCERDTLGMVKMYQRLQRLCAHPAPVVRGASAFGAGRSGEARPGSRP